MLSDAPGAAGADGSSPLPGSRPPSRRLRGCLGGVALFLGNLFAPFAPEPAPPEPRVKLDALGNRLGPDGKPLRARRQERAEQEVVAAQVGAREELVALGINPKQGPLQYLSAKRLKEFVDALDPVKKHIYRKAPKIANALAMDLVQQCSKPTLMTVALPWGSKKGNNQSATVCLKVKDPPYDPDDKTPRSGQLLLVLETEGSSAKSVAVTGCNANTGPDNVIGLVLGKEGTVLLSTADEPTRWKWLLAVNAGLHRVAAIKCMLDQTACTMPWHPNTQAMEEETD